MEKGNANVVDGSGRIIRSKKQEIARLWLPRKAGLGEPSDTTARDKLADEKCARGAKDGASEGASMRICIAPALFFLHPFLFLPLSLLFFLLCSRLLATIGPSRK